MRTNLETLDASVDTPNPILKFRRPSEEESSAHATWLVPTLAQRLYLPLRRVLDFSFALVLTLFAIPIVLLAALIVKLTSRGPAFYTQTRTGKDGKPFTIYKLRSMIDKCESLTGPRWTIPGDPRVTPIGWFLRRSHIDELPQLLNVLQGEMSLIGPRPERPEFVRELEQSDRRLRDSPHRFAGHYRPGAGAVRPDSDVESVRRKLRLRSLLHRPSEPLARFAHPAGDRVAHARHVVRSAAQAAHRAGAEPELETASSPPVESSRDRCWRRKLECRIQNAECRNEFWILHSAFCILQSAFEMHHAILPFHPGERALVHSPQRIDRGAGGRRNLSLVHSGVSGGVAANSGKSSSRFCTVFRA